MKKTSLQTADGPPKELFADGTASGEGRMKSGKSHCEWNFYYRNGQTKAVGKYVDGELNRYWPYWCGKLLHAESGIGEFKERSNRFRTWVTLAGLTPRKRANSARVLNSPL